MDTIFTGTNFSCDLTNLLVITKVAVNQIGLLYANTEPITHMTPRRDLDYDALVIAWEKYKRSIS